MKPATLVFCFKENRILLGMKKRGFGMGKYNGIGGKIEAGETPQEAAARELFEEVGIRTLPCDLKKIGEIVYHYEKGDSWLVHIYFCTAFNGDACETDEMKPAWFSQHELPYEQMWEDDVFWLPSALSGKEIKMTFHFDEHQKLKK